MSRLLNSFSRVFWPQPDATMTLGFVGNTLHALRVSKSQDKLQLTHCAKVEMNIIPFREQIQASDLNALSDAMRRIAVEVPQKQASLQITLPDPAGVAEILEFGQLPASVSERCALARFRLEKDWPQVSRMECIAQELGNAKGNMLLLAMAFDRSWLYAIKTAARQAKLIPSLMDLNTNYVYNRFYPRLQLSGHDGAIIMLEPDYWSVLLYDKTPRPRFYRTRWRDSHVDISADHEAIVQELERLVRAYVLAGAERRVTDIYVYATASEGILFAEKLNVRMSSPCVQLAVDDGIVAKEDGLLKNVDPATLASAVPRV